MDINRLKTEIETTSVFKKMPGFKQNLVLKQNSLQSLLQLHFLAEKHGIGYLKQRVDLNATDVKLIEEVVNIQK